VSVPEGPTPRAQPFYCPYCGEEDFVPFGEEPHRYFCNSCQRHFVVRFLGLGASRRDEASVAGGVEEGS
jgi:transposase-like protein